MEMRKSTFLLLVITLSFFSLVGEESLSEEKAGKAIHRTIGNPTAQSMYALPFVMGIFKGEYLKEGIDLEFITMKTTMALVALNRGDLDYIASGVSTIYGGASGLPIKLVYVLVDRLAQYIISKPEFRTITDLKGKTIGIAQVKSSQELIVKEVAKHHGLDPERDVTLIATGPAMQLPSLFAGSVDSILEGPPHNFLARKKGFKELIRIDNLVKTIGFGIGTRDKKIKDNPKEIKGMIRATIRSLRYVKDNKNESVNYMVKNWGVEREIANETYDIVITNFSKDGLLSEERTKKTIEEGRLLGMKIKDSITPAQVVDFSLLKEVNRELGITP